MSDLNVEVVFAEIKVDEAGDHDRNVMPTLPVEARRRIVLLSRPTS
jgi:hypothetical protein